LADSAVGTQRERARQLVLRFGWNAAAYQILNPGIELWFSSGGDGVVGFVRHGDVLVVGGAPVCDLSRLEEVAAELYGARFYNFGGLDAFKAKFNPEDWEPIYAIAEGASFPPRALYAIAGAFSGGTPFRLVVRALLRA